MWIFDRWSPYSYQNNREKYKNDDEKREFNIKECLWFCMTSLTPQGNVSIQYFHYFCLIKLNLFKVGAKHQRTCQVKYCKNYSKRTKKNLLCYR